MKFLTLLTFLMAANFANAAFNACEYQARPCDTLGNHYVCRVVGWTGPNPPMFCSATDVSLFHPHAIQSQVECKAPIANDAQCLSQCGKCCLDEPVFCGQW